MWNHLCVQVEYFVKRNTFCGWEIAPRYISNYELVLLTKGQGWITVEDTVYHASAGDLFLFRPGVKHSLKVTEEPCMKFYGIHFIPETEKEPLPIPHHIHLKSYSKLHTLCKTLMDAYRQKDACGKWRQNLLMEQILCEVCTILQSQNEPSGIGKIRNVLRYIHENPYQKFTLGELMEIAKMKKSLFMSLFRQVTGTTPMQYIIRLQMEDARDLLMETNLSVTKVAEHCGFTDAFYFSRCFKKHFLLSPQKYRSVHKGN